MTADPYKWRCRLGRFVIGRHFREDWQQGLMLIQSKLLIRECTVDWTDDSMRYVAQAEFFDVVDKGCEVPLYTVIDPPGNNGPRSTTGRYHVRARGRAVRLARTSRGCMTTIYAKHEPYDGQHLYTVLQEMTLCGAPTVRCVRHDGKLYALDSSHRLAAAAKLMLAPKIVVETMDCGEELSTFWHRVAPDRPRYDFVDATCLELDAFVV